MRLLPALAALALGACQPAPAVPSADACGASGMQSMVGQSKSVLAAMTFPVGTRIVEQGMPVTDDYSSERLNVLIGKSGLIEKVSCG